MTNKYSIFAEAIRSIIWLFRTRNWTEDKILEDYQNNENVSDSYGYARSGIYIEAKEYKKALLYCEAGLRKRPSNTALQERRAWLIQKIQENEKGEG